MEIAAKKEEEKEERMMVIMEGELLMKVIGFLLLPPVPHTLQRGMREEAVRA